jgi:putative DNA methylase
MCSSAEPTIPRRSATCPSARSRLAPRASESWFPSISMSRSRTGRLRFKPTTTTGPSNQSRARPITLAVRRISCRYTPMATAMSCRPRGNCKWMSLPSARHRRIKVKVASSRGPNSMGLPASRTPRERRCSRRSFASASAGTSASRYPLNVLLPPFGPRTHSNQSPWCLGVEWAVPCPSEHWPLRHGSRDAGHAACEVHQGEWPTRHNPRKQGGSVADEPSPGLVVVDESCEVGLRSTLEGRGIPVEWSRIAEHESWRKELHRPATYVHKWWARRLGSVFRGLLIASSDGVRRVVSPDHTCLVGGLEGGPAVAPLSGMVVFDPFAGSGTTLVEASKLGARVVGRDINPVATLTQRQAFQSWDFPTLAELFQSIEDGCRNDIDRLHVAEDGSPVLQYFWVAIAPCPECQDEVELFSTYLFAKHAYPQRQPLAHATCPTCHAVCPVNLKVDKTGGHCHDCNVDFDFAGPVRAGGKSGRWMVCQNGHRARVLEALGGTPPTRHMFAKAVRTAAGKREYRSIDSFDLDLYDRAGKLLADATESEVVSPEGSLEEGSNTIQALRWGYRTWASFFNDRQAYALGRIAASIRDLPGSGAEREALAAAFGKTLEHHNLFCSFKGEGTGPVRSIFHNHVLRPERCSVEGNPWGGAGGSGGFADALRRLRAAHEYKVNPRDFRIEGGGIVAVEGESIPLSVHIASSWAEFVSTPDSAYVACGDGSATDLPTGSVSLIVTDPPYVDNVHYSELADFFHAWLRQIRPHVAYPDAPSTRDQREVQHSEAVEFRRMAAGVWAECSRVLADNGLLAFSFHQSRTEGWSALMASLADAQLVVTAVRPVVAEVTTSLSKHSASEPNRIDLIVACRKRSAATPASRSPAQARSDMQRQLHRLQVAGIELGPGDVLTAVRAAVLAQGTRTEFAEWEVLGRSADEQAEIARRSITTPDAAEREISH